MDPPPRQHSLASEWWKRQYLTHIEGPDPPRVWHDGEPPRPIRPVERHCEEEAQGRDRAVDAYSAQNAPTVTRALPRERVRCVPGMLNSSEVKVLGAIRPP